MQTHESLRFIEFSQIKAGALAATFLAFLILCPISPTQAQAPLTLDTKTIAVDKANSLIAKKNCGQSCYINAAREFTSEYTIQIIINACGKLNQSYKNVYGIYMADESPNDFNQKLSDLAAGPADLKQKFTENCLSRLGNMGRHLFDSTNNPGAFAKLNDTSNLSNTNKLFLVETLIQIQENASALVNYNTALQDMKTPTKITCQHDDPALCETAIQQVNRNAIVDDTRTRIQVLEDRYESLEEEMKQFSTFEPNESMDNLSQVQVGVVADIHDELLSNGSTIQVITREDDLQNQVQDPAERRARYDDYKGRLEALRGVINTELTAIRAAPPMTQAQQQTQQKENDQEVTMVTQLLDFVGGWFAESKAEKAENNDISAQNQYLRLNPRDIRYIGSTNHNPNATPTATDTVGVVQNDRSVSSANP